MLEGLPEEDALELADKMFLRDTGADFDDRRICFECKKYDVDRKVCPEIKFQGRPQRPLRFQLQRCDWFVLKGKK